MTLTLLPLKFPKMPSYKNLSLPLLQHPLDPCQSVLFLGASVTRAIRELNCSGNKPFKSQVQGAPWINSASECDSLGGGPKIDTAYKSESTDPELSQPAGQPAYCYTDNKS